MLKTTLLAGALLCLPALAEAARLTSAPLTVNPLNLDPPSSFPTTIEKITCSIHYSGPGVVNGVLRLTTSITGDDGIARDLGGNVSGVPLSPTRRNFSYANTHVGLPIQNVVCDFSFPGVDPARFRAQACIMSFTEHVAVCVPVY